MAAFMTLCEAYMGIEPHFDLCNYFFHPGYNRAQTRWARPTSTPARDDYVDVSRAKLSRSSLLCGVGQYGDQHPDLGALAHRADQNFCSGSVPLREGVDSPWVSLLELTSACLCQFLLLNAYTFLCRIFGTHAMTHGGSRYQRMR
jgi:hypothetical protein